MRTRLHPLWAFGLLASIASVGALGQPCTNYRFSSVPGPAIVPATTDIGNHCDDCTTNLSFPFPVTLYGISYTNAAVSSNGVIQFGFSSGTWTNECLPTSSFSGPAILAYWDDLETDVYADSGIFTRIDGVAPNRTFDIEWRVAYFPSFGNANFVVRFYENQNRFEVLYGAMSNRTGGTIGVQAGPTGPYTMVACNADTGFQGQLFTWVCAAPRITYQGKLTNNGTPVTGSYDMTFSLFRTPVGGSALTGQFIGAVPVTMGLFTVPLDMPDFKYDGDPLYLEIAIGGQVLTGRQELTFAPKAAFAINSSSADLAERAMVAARAEGLSAPDGSPMDAAYVLDNGDVVFTGTIYANDLVLRPYTRWLIIPPSALDPISNTIGHLHASAGDLLGSTATSTDTFVTFRAPVYLPHGVTITRMEFVGYDYSTDDITLTLERVNFDSPTPEFLSSVSSDGAELAYRRFSSGPLNIRVDGQNYGYVVTVHWHVYASTVNYLRMSNIRFTYTVGQTPE